MRVDEIAGALCEQSVPIAGNEFLVVDGTRRRAVRRRIERAAATLHGRLDFRVIETSHMWRAHELNLAADAARHELLLFLGEDFVPGPKWLESHAKLHAARPEPTVVGLGPTRLDDRVRRRPFCRWLEDTGRIYSTGFGEGDPLPPRFFYAGNTSMKRSLFRAAGGFDEVFPYDTTDDCEIGVRLHQLGMQVVYVRAALTRHLHWITLRYRCSQMRKAGESAALLELRHPQEAVIPADCDADPASHFRRAFGALLRSRVLRRADLREQFWQNLLAAFLLYGFERKRRRLAAGKDVVPLPPVPRGEALLALESLSGGTADRRWVVDDGGANVEGLEPVDVFDGRAERSRAKGCECMAFHNPDGSAQAYFLISRPHRFTGRKVEVEVDLLADAEGDGIKLEYDSTDLSVRIQANAPGAFKATPAQALAPTGDWQRLRFAIDDGRFCRTLHGTDFRVVSTRPVGAPLRVRSARVSVCGVEHSTVAPAELAALGFLEVPDPCVSIIIPTRNRLDMLRECLQALRVHTRGAYEVVVVDDDSRDGTADALRSVPGLRLLRLGMNVGFARACNAGASQARAPRLLFLNNDTVALAGWLEPMLAALEREPRVGVVGSRLLYPRIGLVQHAGVELGADGCPYHRLRFEPSEAQGVDEDRIVPAVTGACFLVRRPLFEQLGGFDEEFRNGFEDVDFCLRALQAGSLTLYSSASILLHHESVAEGRLDKEVEAANLQLFRRRWGRAGAPHDTRRARPFQ